MSNYLTMSEKIERLALEQEKLITTYGMKWRQIAFSTEPINYQQATNAVQATYALLGLPHPKILFFDSPYQALINLVFQLDLELGKGVESEIEEKIYQQQKKKSKSN